MTTRTASCACGTLRVITEGEPYAVVICHCTACQRRSGSPFGVGAYFKGDQVSVEGEAREWTRQGSSGGSLTNHFCPTCGSNLFWTSGLHPDGMGIGVGSFAQPDFPPPIRSVWEDHRHHWIEPPVENRFVGPSKGPRVVR